MLDALRQLRQETGAPLSEIKKALESSKGDLGGARRLLRKHGGNVLAKRSGRETHEGVVEAYVHSNHKVGVLLELYAETDFVSRNPQFKELAHDLAMHVAAMNPAFMSADEAPADLKKSLQEDFSREVETSNKHATIKKEMVEGKIAKYLNERSLLNQLFVKNQDKTVAEVLQEAASKFGEKIKVGKFIRFQL